MPDKDGDEEKSTKSVVKKKQKQMMGEEGYDIARDMGRVRPSKDKKDATTMPVSDEVRKTQKVNKGPSAFERVKAKYGKSVMNVGKKKANEELDLTKVAEAFGGYIVEANGKDQSKEKEDNKPVGKGNVPFESGTYNKRKQTEKEIQQRSIENQRKARQARKMTQGAGGTEGLGSGKGSERVTGGEDKLKGTEDQIKGIKTGTRPVEKDVIKRITKEVDDEQVLRGPRADRSKSSAQGYAEITKMMRKGAAKERRAEKLQDPKFRASETLRKAKQTDIKGGPSVKRGDPVPQQVRKIKNAAADIDRDAPYQRNTFKPETGQQTFDKMFGPDSKVRRIQTGEKPVIPDPFGDKTKPKPRKTRTIPFKDRTQLDPETQKKVDAVTPAFATRIGASGKPLPVSMRNVRVPRGRSIVKAEPSEIEKLKPMKKGNIIVRTRVKTGTQDPGIDPEVTTDNPNQRRAGVGNRTLPGTPPKTGPGFGKRFGDFLQFTRNNPVASLIGYDILRKTAGKVKSELKPAGVKGGRAIRVSAGK